MIQEQKRVISKLEGALDDCGMAIETVKASVYGIERVADWRDNDIYSNVYKLEPWKPGMAKWLIDDEACDFAAPPKSRKR